MRHSGVDCCSYKTRASSLIVLVETLNNYSPKPSTLCPFKPKNQEQLPLKELHVHDGFLSANRNNARTNQTRGFPIEHGWVSISGYYSIFWVYFVANNINPILVTFGQMIFLLSKYWEVRPLSSNSFENALKDDPVIASRVVKMQPIQHIPSSPLLGSTPLQAPPSPKPFPPIGD